MTSQKLVMTSKSEKSFEQIGIKIGFVMMVFSLIMTLSLFM